jgi:hypothetical protein
MIRANVGTFKEVEREVMKRVAAIPRVAAMEAARIIRENASEGYDIKGEKMKEYSPEYKKFRAKHGLSSEPVDLRRTGVLLDNPTVVVNGQQARVKPADNRRVIAEGLMRTRKFYPEKDSDFTPEFDKKIVTACESAIDERK